MKTNKYLQLASKYVLTIIQAKLTLGFSWHTYGQFTLSYT